MIRLRQKLFVTPQLPLPALIRIFWITDDTNNSKVNEKNYDNCSLLCKSPGARGRTLRSWFEFKCVQGVRLRFFLCQDRSKERGARDYNLYEALKRHCNIWSNLVLVNPGFRTWKTLRKLSAIWARSQKVLPPCPRPERISFCKGASLGRLHISGRPYRRWYWPVYVSGDETGWSACEGIAKSNWILSSKQPRQDVKVFRRFRNCLLPHLQGAAKTYQFWFYLATRNTPEMVMELVPETSKNLASWPTVCLRTFHWILSPRKLKDISCHIPTKCIVS